MGQEPVFFNTVDEMKAHWQPCLGLNLVAKPPTAQKASKGRGKSRAPTAKVDIGKAGTNAQADKLDSQMLDDDDNVVVENESTE